MIGRSSLFSLPLSLSLAARAWQELLNFWCGEQGHAGSPKCKQMEFGKRMQSTESGEERKRMAMEFKVHTRARDATQALELLPGQPNCHH